MRFKIFSILAFLFFSVITHAQLYLNEILATNATSLIETDFYNFPDFIEIYNLGDADINLSDYYLSDDQDSLFKWKFPAATLHSKQYYLVYCDKENTGRHTNFGLSADGENVFLTDKNGTLIDHLSYGQQYPDISYGRDPSNLIKWYYCPIPSPGSLNSISTAIERTPKTEYSMPAGRLNSTATLSLTGNTIKYSTNGAAPNTNSSNYSQPLTINKTMNVKTKNYKNNYLPGEVYANTYFLNEHTFTLPVVVISFNPEYFYDNTIGIHVRGTNGTAGLCGSVANWNQNWERAAYLEYFDENGVKQISQPIGVKLAGGCTRGRDQKSMSLYARSKYGNNDLDYPFFKQKPDINSYKSLLLRSSGNDQDQTLLRDAFLQSLVNQSMDIDFQSYQPVIVYFNDEYRGLMNLREKFDEDYFLSNYAISSNEVDFLEGVLRSDFDHSYNAIRGSLDEYKSIISYISSNSLADDANYNLVASRLDLQEYINYMTLEIYVANRDWPGNNLKFWKKSINGKWRWMVFDLDYGFGFRLDENGYTHQTFEYVTEPDGSDHPNPPWSTILFRKLLENNGFKKQFLSTYIAHMYSSFTPEWCNYVLDSLSSRIDFEITYNQLKYGRTKDQWLQYLNTFKTYALNRSLFMSSYVKQYFNLSDNNTTVTITNPSVSKGKVIVNEALIQMYPFNMKTCKEIPLYVKAVPGKGYKFVKWNISGQSSIDPNKIEFRSDTSFTVTAEPVFEPVDATDGIYLNEIASTTSLFRDEYNEKSGFVELCNNTGEDKVLYSFFISDKYDHLMRYAIPDSTVIPADGFITFYLDGEAKQGILHASFKADNDGESFYLSQKTGETVNIIDSVSFTRLYTNHSFGKYADGTGDWQYMADITPGEPNNPEIFVNLKDNLDYTVEMKIYPNPSDGSVTVHLDGENTGSINFSILIFDLSGKLTFQVSTINIGISTIDLSNLKNGYYLIKLFKGTKVVDTDRLIIIK